MNKEKLEEIYYSNSNLVASKIIGVSVPTLLKIIDKEKIQRKGSGRPYSNKKIKVVR